MAEETKPNLPALLTPQTIVLKVTAEALKLKKPTIADLEARALVVVKNRDNLKVMADLLEDIKAIRKIAESVHEKEKAPHLERGRTCDTGKKLVLLETDRIEGMFKKDYDRLLKEVADDAKVQTLKKAKEEAIKKGIEDNLIVFSNKIIAAVNPKQLTEVESLINLQKSPSMAKKYGEFHAQACERFDTVLKPIILSQKEKLKQLSTLNADLLAAEAGNDPDKMDELMAKVDDVSNEMLQNHADLQDAVLSQEPFPVAYAEEVLPEYKVKRTNYTFEIADVEVAFKKSRHLLEISIDGKFARTEMDALGIKEQLKDKDEVVVNGIRYKAERVREAL